MLVHTFRLHADGTHSIDQHINMERMPYAAFAKAYGGAACGTPPEGFSQPPVGYSFWKTAKGSVFAIRDQDYKGMPEITKGKQ